MTRWWGAALASVALTLAGCSGSSGGSGTSGQAPTVFAASSLTDAFTAANAGYVAAGNAKATLSFAGSQDLVTQIANGAPADVIATADTKTIATVADKLVSPQRTFAHNRLVIITAKGNPKHIRTLADLAAPHLRVVLADPSVPAGNYAAQALTAANVHVSPKSLELDVRSVLTKVELGEADAGIVYVTDATSAAGKVTAVPIANAPLATYQIGALDASGTAFVNFVLSTKGQAILHRFGFLPP